MLAYAATNGLLTAGIFLLSMLKIPIALSSIGTVFSTVTNFSNCKKCNKNLST